MAKKFGKFLLFTVAAGTALAGAYYYLQKKSQLASDYDFDDDDDYDDFSEDLDDTETTRSYVPLNTDTAVPAPADEAADSDDADTGANGYDGDFSSLAEQVQEKKDEQVEEFFDEDAEA